jgi:membrane associated rhomboid family serine protease
MKVMRYENSEENRPTNTVWEFMQTPLLILGGFIVFIWIVELADFYLLNSSLDQYGIHPRTVRGLYGIFAAPFLHGGLGHVMANTMPILVLGILIMFTRGVKDFLAATAVIVLIGGLGTWLTGASGSVHIGASGLIFGYFGFLLLITWFERSCRNLVITGFVIFLYSGMIWGILPGRNGISWQSHLFGLIGGIVAAYLIASGSRRQFTAQPDDGVLRITDEDLY